MKIEKTRLTFDKKYMGKQVYITFRYSETTYLYPHDELLEKVLALGTLILGTESWDVNGHYNRGKLSLKLKELLEDYKLT